MDERGLRTLFGSGAVAAPFAKVGPLGDVAWLLLMGGGYAAVQAMAPSLAQTLKPFVDSLGSVGADVVAANEDEIMRAVHEFEAQDAVELTAEPMPMGMEAARAYTDEVIAEAGTLVGAQGRCDDKFGMMDRLSMHYEMWSGGRPWATGRLAQARTPVPGRSETATRWNKDILGRLEGALADLQADLWESGCTRREQRRQTWAAVREAILVTLFPGKTLGQGLANSPLTSLLMSTLLRNVRPWVERQAAIRAQQELTEEGLVASDCAAVWEAASSAWGEILPAEAMAGAIEPHKNDILGELQTLYSDRLGQPELTGLEEMVLWAVNRGVEIARLAGYEVADAD